MSDISVHRETPDLAAVAVRMRGIRKRFGSVEACRDIDFEVSAGETFGIIGKVLRKDLQRDVAAESGIVRTIHLAHAARPEQRDHLVGTEPSPSNQHGMWPDYR